MNERVKELRKELGLTMEKFGNQLGVHKTAIQKIENGTNNLTDQMLKLICREFGVSEEWLRTGSGEMFLYKNSVPIDDLLNTCIVDDLEAEMIKTYLSLPPDFRKFAINRFKEKLSNKPKQ